MERLGWYAMDGPLAAGPMNTSPGHHCMPSVPLTATAVKSSIPIKQSLGPKFSGQEDQDISCMSKKERRKRRVKPVGIETGDLMCGVCGDKAHGYNFNAITCESCKAFFRRNAARLEKNHPDVMAQVIKCNFDGNCKLDPHTRRFCTECRLKKCFDIGMRKEWILSDEQLQKRRERSLLKKDRVKYDTKLGPMAPTLGPVPMNVTPCGNTSTGSGGSGSTSSTPSETSSGPSPQILQIPSPDGSFNSNSSGVLVKSEPESPPSTSGSSQESPSSSSVQWDTNLEEAQRNIATLEAMLTQTVDSPYSEADCSKFMPSSASGMFNMADTFIRRFIKFCKCMPEFSGLTQADQIALLKGGIMEVMILRGALKFDMVALSFKFSQAQGSEVAAGQINSKLIEKNLGKADSPAGQYNGDAVQFFMSLNELVGGDKTAILLLLVIELFSPDRANLEGKIKVEAAQEQYSYLLQLHIQSKYPPEEARILYPKLLMKLVEVRELGELSSKAASRLDIQSVEPLLVEVFSLQ
ncbi:oxysterols receptor LXR-alpha-like isoform X2 [Lineus longissimus]|uniref:oxysterols receptor LXR-alpha-like isoform X2 n=1 Tax=Lineus longissimus TaxID=88925 RepID=UPI00315DEDE4